MAYEEALATANLFRAAMVDYARLLIASPQKSKRLRMTTQGFMLAADLEAVISRLDAQSRADVLYVLEHATLTLPPESPLV